MRDLSDGRSYVGWTAEIIAEGEGWPAVGSRTVITDEPRVCSGHLTHELSFPDLEVMTYLPKEEVQLIPPAVAEPAPPAS